MKIIWSKYERISPLYMYLIFIFQTYFSTRDDTLSIRPDIYGPFTIVDTFFGEYKKYVIPFEILYTDILYKINDKIYDDKSYLTHFDEIKKEFMTRYIKKLL